MPGILASSNLAKRCWHFWLHPRRLFCFFSFSNCGCAQSHESCWSMAEITSAYIVVTRSNLDFITLLFANLSSKSFLTFTASGLISTLTTAALAFAFAFPFAFAFGVAHPVGSP